jgi:hypothetical protein
MHSLAQALRSGQQRPMQNTGMATVTPRRHPNFSVDYNENEALVIGESLDERERRG